MSFEWKLLGLEWMMLWRPGLKWTLGRKEAVVTASHVLPVHELCPTPLQLLVIGMQSRSKASALSSLRQNCFDLSGGKDQFLF